MRKIGLLGGTFSPPHTGHLHAAKAAVEELGLDELWFLPAAQPPHKALPAGTPTPGQRAEMTELLARELSEELPEKCSGVNVSVCRMELELPPPSYTARTVSLLREQYPDDDFTFIVGSDMLLSLARWYHPEIILQKVRIAALSRHDADTAKLRACAEELKERFGGEIVLLNAAVREMSSTELREMLEKLKAPVTSPEKLRTEGVPAEPPEGLTPAVYRYILENGLYREGKKV